MDHARNHQAAFTAPPFPGWGAGWQAPRPAAGRREGALLGVGIALWGVTYVSLGLLTCAWGVVLIFWAAAGEPVGPYVLHTVGAALGAAVLLAALAFAPGIRKLSAAARLALLGALACPGPLVLALWTWSAMD
ncbi:hypothetical protein [Streptomyces sp. NBC_01304]|uniref:hypothetical protein n=1 Tax=Streptomyces sp. NBC_01304 TaxID=2903818 RepID=UPI002E1561BD|nr:hypothetical protein OG430_18810 [Streptomyces sp. NBC_01304]